MITTMKKGINLNKINSNLRKEIAINPKCTDADIVAWSLCHHVFSKLIPRTLLITHDQSKTTVKATLLKFSRVS